MHVVIVGGGRTGLHLAGLLLEGRHSVRIVERRGKDLLELQRALPAEVVVPGDGSSPEVLERAGIREAKVLAAVAGLDESNLVVCTLARFEFRVARTIARINNPINAWLFTPQMGVDVALNQADLLAKMVTEEMSMGDMMTLFKLRRGAYSMVEEKIPPGAKAVGMHLRDLQLPKNCLVCAILRGAEVVVPQGATQLLAGDEVLSLVDSAGALHLAALFARPGETPLPPA
ncbi:MAG: TrkA family potassium uptake protein [Chloroflexi bacterium]|nr:TrkA family potassium uptake protein [Chloroflexota bacterium]MDA1216674.1 TrkA family potassium uptake protein [Chloroflexota bacterium]